MRPLAGRHGDGNFDMSGWVRRIGPRAALLAVLPLVPLLPGIARGTEALPPDTAPPSLSGNYLAGRFAQRVDDWGSAADYLQQVLQVNPADVALSRRTFMLLLGEGRIGEALPLARRLIAEKGDAHLASTLVMAEAMAAGRLDVALEQLRTLPSEGLAQYVRPLLESWLWVARGDAAKALETLAVLKTAPGFAPLHDLHAGLISEIAGDTDGAARWYASALDDAPPLRIVQVVGAFQERAGRPDDARALYERFRERHPETRMIEPALNRLGAGRPALPVVADARQGLAEALFDLASALHQEGVEETALLYGQIALFLRPDFALARLMIGDVLSARDQDEAALTQYRAIADDPDLGWTARLRAADGLNQLDRLDEALSVLETMAGQRPDRPEPLIRMGDLLRSAKRFAEAAPVYERALARVGAIEARHWTLFYARGLSYDRLGRWTDAEADLLKALELSPEQPHLLNYLGYSWVDRGRNLEKARGMIERAVQLKPDDGYITDSLGWVLYLLSDLDGALKYMERAVELRPLDATINDHLGDVYWAVGRKAEARFQWNRAIFNADAQEDEQLIAAVRSKLERGPPERRAEVK